MAQDGLDSEGCVQDKAVGDTRGASVREERRQAGTAAPLCFLCTVPCRDPLSHQIQEADRSEMSGLCSQGCVAQAGRRVKVVRSG